MTASPDKMVRNCAMDGGADVVGFSSIGPIRDRLAAFGPMPSGDLPFAITVGLRLNGDIVDKLLLPEAKDHAKQYWEDCYRVVNNRLDALTASLAQAITGMGFHALAVPATLKIDADSLLGPFSHKAAARYAGQGWIGKNCMLITPEVGPRIRWGTVLTNAPFRGTERPMENACGSCRACVDICPVNAYTGAAFREDDPLSVRYDVRACKKYQASVSICSLCLAVCPKGRHPSSAATQARAESDTLDRHPDRK